MKYILTVDSETDVTEVEVSHTGTRYTFNTYQQARDFCSEYTRKVSGLDEPPREGRPLSMDSTSIYD